MTEAKSGAAKLRLKPDQAIYVINKPDGYEELVGGLPSLARVVGPADEPPDVVHLFVRDHAQLQAELPTALAAVPDPAKNPFWVSYPRKEADPASDLDRAVVWRELVKHGWRPVSGIAIDETWSAMRGRP